jgi:hypothetical protein
MGEPRIKVVPAYTRTAGPQVTRLAGMAGIDLDEAQQLIAHAVSGVDGNDRWAAFEAVIFAPRQNLKTEYLIARILAGLYLFREELILFSAHQARTTAEVFRRVRRAIERGPELGARIARVSNKPGAETIELDSGQRLQCVARSTSTGRGFTGDVVILDEAHNLDSDELAAILPMLSTRANPQVLYALSVGTEESTHLAGLRARALSGHDPHVCWIEWSMAEGDRVDDRAVWAACNPAYPARITPGYLEREFAALGPEGFARERLGKSSWPTDETGRYAVISRDAWQACALLDRPPPGSLYPVSLGVAVSVDGRSAVIAACGTGASDLPVVEVADYRPGDGTAWVGPRLADLTSRHNVFAAAWDERGMAGPLSLATYTGDTELVTPKAGELAQACAAFFYAADQRGLRHTGDSSLTMAVGAARIRPAGGAWVWDNRAYAAEVLHAATLALHASASDAGGLGPEDVTVLWVGDPEPGHPQGNIPCPCRFCVAMYSDPLSLG